MKTEIYLYKNGSHNEMVFYQPENKLYLALKGDNGHWDGIDLDGEYAAERLTEQYAVKLDEIGVNKHWINEETSFAGDFRSIAGEKCRLLAEYDDIDFKAYVPDYIKCGFQISRDGVLRVNNDFENYVDVTEIVIPDKVKRISHGAFEGYPNLERVIMSDSVTSIGSRVFSDCKNLKEVTLSENIDTIPSFTFENCTSLEFIDLPKNLKTIEDNAFVNCTSLKSLNVPKGTIISRNAISGCDNLESVELTGKQVADLFR